MINKLITYLSKTGNKKALLCYELICVLSKKLIFGANIKKTCRSTVMALISDAFSSLYKPKRMRHAKKHL